MCKHFDFGHFSLWLKQYGICLNVNKSCKVQTFDTSLLTYSEIGFVVEEESRITAFVKFVFLIHLYIKFFSYDSDALCYFYNFKTFYAG